MSVLWHSNDNDINDQDDDISAFKCLINNTIYMCLENSLTTIQSASNMAQPINDTGVRMDLHTNVTSASRHRICWFLFTVGVVSQIITISRCRYERATHIKCVYIREKCDYDYERLLGYNWYNLKSDVLFTHTSHAETQMKYLDSTNTLDEWRSCYKYKCEKTDKNTYVYVNIYLMSNLVCYTYA